MVSTGSAAGNGAVGRAIVASIMLTLLLIAAAAAALGGYVAYRVGRSRSNKQLPAPSSSQNPLLERTIRDVRVDDVIQHGGTDYLVEGIIQYDEDGHTWRAARILDGGKVKWMMVGLERGPALTVRLLTAAADVDLTAYPPDTLERADVTYKVAQKGTATVTTQGNVSDIPGTKGLAAGAALRCRWWRYSAAGEKALLIEQWGDSYRALVGETVPSDDVELLAAS
jgi:hypothetical protein